MSSKSVASLPGIGPAYQNHLERINILTLTDLLQHFPSRFLDFSITTPIHLLKLKQSSSFKATIDSPTSFYSNSGKYITTATATDKTGNINLVWFNSRFISSLIKPNSTYTIAGTPTFYSKKLAIFSPQIELFTGKESLNTQGFVPIYPLTKGISSKWLRAKVKLLLNQTSVKETLSKATLQKLNLPNINQALSHIHFPPSLKHQDQADKRLAFNQHLKICQKNLREQKKRPPATKITINQPTHLSGLKKLPFKLTKDQTKALKDCYKDINSTTSSRRLIHGDTGSGKTAGLILLANQCLHSQFSFVLLAPTQILAKQHEATFKKCLFFLKTSS